MSYEVTNGLAPAVTGQVTIQWRPAPLPQPPVVATTFATVRAGQEVNLDVLDSASDPDGEGVHLVDAVIRPGNNF